MCTVINRIKSLFDKNKIIFVAITTLTMCLIAHGFMYFNELFSHDSMLLMYNTDANTMISLGRFLRPLYNSIKGYMNTPVMNGLLSMVYLSAVSYLVLDIFKVNNKGIIVLVIGVLCTNYSVSILNATYIHDVDAYMFSLLLDVIGLWLFINFKYGFLAGIIPLTLSLGLYQSYIDFILFAYLILCIIRIIKEGISKEVFVSILEFGIMVGISMIFYYALFKGINMILGLNNNGSYQNPSNVLNLSAESIKERLDQFFVSIEKWFLYPRGIHRNWAALINKLFFVLDICLAAYLLIRNKTNLFSIVCVVILAFLCPIGMNFITLISNVYHDLTIYSFHFYYLIPLVLLSQIDNIKHIVLKSVLGLVCICISVLIYDNCLYSNQIYLKKDLEDKSTLFAITRIIDRVEQTDGYILGETPIAIVGSLNTSEYGVRRDGFDYTGTGLGNTYAVTYGEVYRTYISKYLNYPAEIISSEKEIEELEKNEEIRNMPFFPAKDSVKLIDGIIVVKLS